MLGGGYTLIPLKLTLFEDYKLGKSSDDHLRHGQVVFQPEDSAVSGLPLFVLDQTEQHLESIKEHF